MKLPRHNTVVAYAALFVALGGTGYAASQIPDNSVGSAQIRNGSVQSRDLARSVLSRKNAKLASTITDVVTDPASGLQINVNATDGKDGAPGPMGPQGDLGLPSSIPGPQGVQGVKGDTGDRGLPGGLTYYAAVDATGAGTISGFTVTHPATGIYCLDSGATIHVATATPYGDGPSDTFAHVAIPGTGSCAGKTVQVTVNTASSAPLDLGFYFVAN